MEYVKRKSRLKTFQRNDRLQKKVGQTPIFFKYIISKKGKSKHVGPLQNVQKSG